DADVCTGVETCDAALDCQQGEALECDDSVGCTVDSCDATEGCANAPDDTLCDDQDVCTGTETCDVTGDCQPGEALGCDDGVGCTVDSCDEETDAVIHTPEDGLCDDGDICDGAESCDEAVGCLEGDPLVCVDDGDPCTEDGCDPSGGCTYLTALPGSPECTTDWSLISDSLYDKLELLPSPPPTPLEVDWPEHGAQLRRDTLEASDVLPGWAPEPGCTSGLWDPERVTAGSSYLGASGVEKCWAAAGSGSFYAGFDERYFYFRNRDKNTLGDPIVGDPAWVQTRFPIPPGHEIGRLEIELYTLRLFGFPPELCFDSWTQEDGSCDYNTVEAWDETDAGLYLLWTVPGASHYEITGPHLPTQTPVDWHTVT
ncbi:MAG: hypothetical protein QF464_23020, partial [Myxococcota bacterium]|nr:hypothetical protein [Myxococcota bacterium]